MARSFWHGLGKTESLAERAWFARFEDFMTRLQLVPAARPAAPDSRSEAGVTPAAALTLEAVAQFAFGDLAPAADAGAATDGPDDAGGANASGGAMVLVRMKSSSDESASRGPILVFHDEDPEGASIIAMVTRQTLECPVGSEKERDAEHGLATGWAQFAAASRVASIQVEPGNRLGVVAAEGDLAAGQTRAVIASTLVGGEALLFDGSAESDGAFILFGGNGDDTLGGGGGADVILGGDGADLLIGGGGADIFVYGQAGQSTGTGHDRLFDFDPTVDRIDLPFAVSGFAAAVTVGSLSSASFDDDLVAALGGLGAGQAVVFRPNDGELLGEVFLIVDANGEAGYQPGEDYVFALPNTDLADLTGNPDIFV